MSHAACKFPHMSNGTHACGISTCMYTVQQDLLTEDGSMKRFVWLVGRKSLICLITVQPQTSISGITPKQISLKKAAPVV